MIHRAASVSFTDRTSRAVIYQVFGNEPYDYYLQNLRALAQLLAPSRAVGFFVLACALEESDIYSNLVGRWISGDREGMSDAVRKALLDGPLLSFPEPIVAPAN